MTDLSIYSDRYKFSGTVEQALYFVGDWHDYEAKTQPDFCKAHGLKPDSYFLDLACGCLRGTLPLVEYLESDRFHGADISEGLLDVARVRVAPFRQSKHPRFFKITDYNFEKAFDGKKFDFILSVSLLTHLLPEVIPDLFAGVAQILKPEGVWYFTMYPTDKIPGVGDVEMARQNRQWLMDIGQTAGLIISDLDDGLRPNDCPGTSSAFQPTVNSTLGQWVMKAVLA